MGEYYSLKTIIFFITECGQIGILIFNFLKRKLTLNRQANSAVNVWQGDSAHLAKLTMYKAIPRVLVGCFFIIANQLEKKMDLHNWSNTSTTETAYIKQYVTILACDLCEESDQFISIGCSSMADFFFWNNVKP